MKYYRAVIQIAVAALICASLPATLRAQAPEKTAKAAKSAKARKAPLERIVAVRAADRRLGAILDELAEAGDISFSYQSDILPKDRLVTLTIRESTLRRALEVLLGEGFDFSQTDDFVIIRRRAAGPAAAVAHKSNLIRKRDSGLISAGVASVRQIIAEMIADGIVRDKDSFSWFGLDKGQFVVDGKSMPDSVRMRYAKKYVGPDEYGYYYGPVAIHGRGYFFDKGDIYGRQE